MVTELLSFVYIMVFFGFLREKKYSVTNAVPVHSLRFSQIYYFAMCLFLSLSFAATFTACDMTDFGDINKDPNEPSEANTGMLFTYACTYVKYLLYELKLLLPVDANCIRGIMSEKNNNQYGAFGGPTMSTSSYYLYPLKNCQKIIDFNSDEAEKGKPAIVQFGDNANQIAVARTLMGFIYNAPYRCS